MDLKIGKIHDKVLIDKEYMTLDQKYNMINKLYAFTKTEKEIEEEPKHIAQKDADVYVELIYKEDKRIFNQLPSIITFKDQFSELYSQTEEVLQYINFDDASDEFIKLYLNQIGNLNPSTINMIFNGMLDSLDKHPNLMGTLGNFLKKQYVKNSAEYPNLLKCVHTKIHNKKLYLNIDVATKWDDFFNVN